MKSLRYLRAFLLGIALLSTAASTAILIQKDRAQNNLAALTATSAALESQLHQKRSTPFTVPSPHSATPSLAATPPPSSTDESLAEELALQTLQLIARRAAFPTRYAPYLRSQPLSATQLTALENLVSRREEQRLDLSAVIRSHRLPTSDPAVVRLRAQTDREFRQTLIELIGQEPAETLAEFERKLPAWELVGNFAGTAALEGQPLTPDQATELAEVIASASPSYQSGNDVATADIDWPAVITGTTAVLTPPQAVSFRNMAPRYPIENPLTRAGP